MSHIPIPRRGALASGAAAVIAAAALAACGSSSSSGGASSGVSGQSSGNGAPTAVHKGGTMTIYTEDSYSPSGVALDPAQSWSLATTSMGLLNRRLTTWKIERTGVAKYTPDLATNTGTPSQGGRVWTYHLKSGIRFSNGQPITAQDFKYGIERTYAPALSGGENYQKPLIAGTKNYKGPFDGKSLSSIQTPNSRTIVFHLNQPYGDWPWVVSTVSMSPVPAGHAPAATFSHHPVTSGPYAVQSANSSQITLVRNKYWSAKSDPVRTAGPNEIVMKLNQNPTVEAQTLISDGSEAKNAFGADFVPPAQLDQAENNPSAKSRVVTSPASPLEYLALNMKSPKLANPKVRQALEYAVDRQSIVVASGGQIAATPATTLMTPGIQGRENYDMYPAGESGNVAKAKQLLAQAGAKNLSLTLITENEPIKLGAAQAIQQAYSKIGVKVNLKSLSVDAWNGLATGNNAGAYDLSISYWQPDYPSGYDNIEPLFDASNIGNGNYNVSRLNDPALQKLMTKAEGTLDPAAAGKLWAQADKTVMRTASAVPLIFQRQSFLRGSNVQNFYIGTFPAYPLYTKASLGG